MKFPVVREVRMTVNFGGVPTRKGHMGAFRDPESVLYLDVVVVAWVYTYEKLS